MKNIFNKNIFIFLIGFMFLLLELLMTYLNLSSLNILTYLLVVAILPAITLFIVSFFYGMSSKSKKIHSYILSLIFALIFAITLLVYCEYCISSDVISKIIENSVTSNTTQASMSPATVGDNIQSILLFIAFSGIGCFLGNLKKHKIEKKTEYNQYD